jgi:CBS domain-containing protein
MGIWNAFVFFFIGIFLKGAADGGYTNTVNHAILGNLRVADIMTRDPICIPDRTPLSMAVEDYFLSGRYTAYPVADEEGNFRGLLRMEYLKALPREKWAFTTAGDFAAAHNDILSTIDINHSAEYAMQCLGGAHTMLAVLDNGKVAGIVTLHDTLHFISIHTELKPAPSAAKAAFNPGDKAGRP